LPRRRQNAPPPAGQRGDRLRPGGGPLLVVDGMDLGVPADVELHGTQSGAVGLDGAEQGGGGRARRVERPQPRRRGRRLLLDHAEGALLPEEVRQALGRLRGGGNGELPELHQEPKSCFIRSTKDVCSGPTCWPESRLNSSSSSRSSALGVRGPRS